MRQRKRGTRKRRSWLPLVCVFWWKHTVKNNRRCVDAHIQFILCRPPCVVTIFQYICRKIRILSAPRPRIYTILCAFTMSTHYQYFRTHMIYTTYESPSHRAPPTPSNHTYTHVFPLCTEALCMHNTRRTFIQACLRFLYRTATRRICPKTLVFNQKRDIWRTAV